jgi:tRNA dimethylallyltransferase
LPERPRLLAIFGPTAAGKTGVAVALSRRLRERGEDPVAINCDAIQVYRGLETLSGAASASEQAILEHRLLSFVDLADEFSAGAYAARAHAEIDSLLEHGRLPVVVGGTGLYLRAALSELDLRPPVGKVVRAAVEREIEERGPQALHAELDPRIAVGVHPNDRKRIARWTELARSGIDPPASSRPLWTGRLRHPTLLIGLLLDREELDRRIEERVERMAAGATREARAAAAAGVSRTAHAALGFGAFAAGDLDAVKAAHRRYARRQLTWMQRMEGVTPIDRSSCSDAEVAERIDALLAGQDP